MKRRIKNFLAIALSAMLIMTQGTFTSAEVLNDTTDPDEEPLIVSMMAIKDPIITPFFIYVNTILPTLSISKGKARCYTEVTMMASKTVRIFSMLRKSTDNVNYSDVASCSETSDGYFHVLDGTINVSSGYYYRHDTTISVGYTVGGGQLYAQEVINVQSNVVYY